MISATFKEIGAPTLSREKMRERGNPRSHRREDNRSRCHWGMFPDSGQYSKMSGNCALRLSGLSPRR